MRKEIGMKRYDCVIWDFNGTILDDVAIGIESINALLKRRGMKKISSVEEYRESFGFPIIKWYKDLGFDFEVEDYDAVANEWMSEYLSREKNAPLCRGALELMEHFYNKGVCQVIISAAEINMLKRQVEALKIDKYFNEIVGKSDIYASGKSEIAQKWRARNPGDMLFIGDTDHDLETAKAIEADCVLVACGHQSYERLTALARDEKIRIPVVKHMGDILSL
ncbi:MAG: HAD family hydrolase [Ruminococcaceae bacterium]|nr:HAD family hydrolase [Oscillospiraceae bacterium]